VGVKLSVSPEGYAVFKCPGCSYNHHIRVRANGATELPPPIWDWNGSETTPTVSPSINFQTVGSDGVSVVCHSFVELGKIRFLDDCTHALKGQTVEIPDWA